MLDLTTKRILLYLNVSIYCMLLLRCYALIAEQFSYMGYFYRNDIFTLSGLPFLTMAFLPCAFLRINVQKPSDFFIAIIYFVVYIPTALVPYLMGSNDSVVLFGYVCSCLFGLFAVHLLTKKTKVFIATFDLYGYRPALRIVSYLLLVTALLYLFFSYRSIINLVKFDHIYQQRAKYNACTSTMPMAAYVHNFIMFVVVPFVLLYGCISRKISFIILGFIVSLFIYSISAMKSTILLPFVVILFYYVLIFYKNKISSNLIIFFLIITCLLGLFNNFILSIIVRRLLVTPGMLSSWYINYSLHHPLLFFSYSKLGYLLGNHVNNLHVPYLVSNFIVGRSYDANANFLASSAVDLGYKFGPIIVSLMLSVFLIVVDNISNGLQRVGNNYFQLVLISCFPFLLSLCNTSFLTSLYSGGAIFNFLLLYILLSCAYIHKYDASLSK